MADMMMPGVAPAGGFEDLGTDPAQAPTTAFPGWDDARLLELFKRLKEESFAYRWVWEREWLRDIFYVGNRQWITYSPVRREWVDKRLQKWVPRPVTNKMLETVSSIRSNMSAINLSVLARPVGHDTQSISTAQIVDQMSPLIHEEHAMQQVMREADFWFIVTGNALLQLSWDTDVRFNRSFIQSERCLTCGAVSQPQDIAQAGNVCPACGGNQLTPAMDPEGKPAGEWISNGKGKTTALSPFEWAVPSNVTRFDEVPYLIRMRWREKNWYEANRPELVPYMSWEKSPIDRSMQIYKTLALTNDVGSGTQFNFMGYAGQQTVEGITEYELWMKPTKDFPKGLVLRVAGDTNPQLVHQEQDEGIPGPFPYVDIEGNPLFPFVHAQYEHMGGRLYGRSALSPIIQKQDQLNQVDSLTQLIVQRMANPIWVVPEGAGIDHFTGEPGLVMKWNPLASGGQAKPERVAGAEVPGSLYQLRAQITQEIEALSGTFDIFKGKSPSGKEAFSALQLLVERSQSRFAAAYQSRGEMYRNWFSVAIELERQFGPQQRTLSVLGPNKGYTFKHFENAQLQGQISFIIEDGSNAPKTSLGKRAAMEQANQMRLLNPMDPEQKYAMLQLLGLTEMVPTLNFHVQTALQVQDSFERWAENPASGPMPLVLKPWHDPMIHWVERIKWLNTDRMREVLATRPDLEPIVGLHLQELKFMMMPPPLPEEGNQGDKAPGKGQALSQSRRESNKDNSPQGNAQMPNVAGPGMGPV